MVENSLFNQPLMNKYLKKYKKELKLTHKKKEAVLKWIKKLENGELKDEVSNYGLFSRLILETILDYDYEENIEENVKEDYGRGFSEFAIKKDGKKFMVIELKGSETDLDKPQQRKNDKRTPVDQAFDYAKRSGDINWILVSNYDEFRLYNWHKKQHQHISFKAEELKDPETFKSFMLVLSKFSTVEHNLIEKLLSKTIFVERDLEAEFYKLFNETRLMLIAELEHIHPEFTREESVHYSQLILNRYIFICFAEDLGLLPGEISVRTIETPIKNENLGRSEIWHRLNGLFLDVNEGSDLKKEKIYGYNGGLFKKDLEFLNIRDVIDDHSIFKDAYQKWKFEEYTLIVKEKLGRYEGIINPIYKNLMTISAFNFSSEVDVNILGHIFENSIGDIEELKANEKGRRKKDGIFYTPEYITDYICRNTIIPYLSKSGKSNTVDDLVGEYWGSEIEDLYEKTKNIKVIDPACGSGAFLNKASDVLLEIHKAIHKHQYKDDKTLMPYFDSINERRKILLNNIYGVDLNEESVEITKLSLFLKISREGLKLPNLDSNIKCGNSVVDDPEYTNKSFIWENEFKNIFENGGFDIIIGNPPYVRHHKITDYKKYFENNYQTHMSRSDLYVYFFEKGLKILKTGGKLGFISSNKFTKVRYGQSLRRYLLENSKFEIFIDYTFDNIFTDATTYPSIFILEKGFDTSENQIFVNNEFKFDQARLDHNAWNFERTEVLDLQEKIKKNGIKLKDFGKLRVYRGIQTGYNTAFVIDENIKNQLIEGDPKNKEIIKPLIRGKDVSRWQIDFEKIYLILVRFKEGENLKNDYPLVYEHLRNYESKLKNRGQVKNGQHHWLELDNNPKLEYTNHYENPKLIYPEIANQLFFVYDDEKYYTNAKCFFITSEDVNLKYLSAVLSSKTLSFFFMSLGTPLQGNYFNLSKIFIDQLPVYPATVKDQQILIEYVDKILILKNELNLEINGFLKWLKREPLNLAKSSQKLDKFYEMSFEDFIKELNNKKVNVKQRDTQELLEKEFKLTLTKVNPLIKQIKELDNLIDSLIYDLYELTEFEIEIIEDRLKR